MVLRFDGGVARSTLHWVRENLARLQPAATVMNGCCSFNETDNADWRVGTDLCVSPNSVTWGGTESGIAADPTWSTGVSFGGGDPASPSFSSRESDTTCEHSKCCITTYTGSKLTLS